jgi:ornithine carbamoyltransferase
VKNFLDLADHGPDGVMDLLGLKEWGSIEHYGDAEADARARAALGDWTLTDSWLAHAQPDCHLMHCLPVRRNVAIADQLLDGPRSRVLRQAHNRRCVQMAVLYRLLDGGTARPH